MFALPKIILKLCHLHREEIEIKGQLQELSRLEIRRNRPKNDLGQYLGKIVDAEKATGKPIRLIRMRVAAKAVRLLFKELVNEMT